MRDKLLFLLIFHFLCLFSFCQQKSDTRIIEESGDVTESFENSQYYVPTKIPFRNIVVIDKRFDTTKLGYTNSNLKIHLGNSWTIILNSYFKKNLDPSSDKTLFIFIKSFWMQRGFLNKLVRKKVISRPAFGEGDGDTGLLNPGAGGCCSATIETFAEKDSLFQALFKIDTFFLNPITNFRKNKLGDFFFLPFDSLLRAMAHSDINGLVNKRKKISWKELDEYYNNRLNLPICKDPFIKKGIFMTFEDFKNNKPLETDFRLKEGRVTDELYIRHGQDEQLVDDYWAFFDGSFLYIKAGFSAFKAIRQQNTFEIYGSLYVSNYHNSSQPGDIINTSGLDKKILQVNMDKGEFY